MDKVFIYHMGCKYEGGSAVSIHKTREGALAAAEKEATEASKRGLEWAVEEYEDYKEHWILTTREDGFEIGSDIYIVYEAEVLE